MQPSLFLVYRDHIVIYRLQEMYSSTFPHPHKRFMALHVLLWRGSRNQLQVSGGDKPRSELWKYKRAKLRLPQMHNGQLHKTLQRTMARCCDISQRASTCRRLRQCHVRVLRMRRVWLGSTQLMQKVEINNLTLAI